MKRKAFTLLELLLVIAIMGFMGTVAVGGYRAMRRGMEERSVMQNVSQFIRSAYQRAQIDRQPVSVYFWNETLHDEEGDHPLEVVGHAVAVRRAGRLTDVQGEMLYDEFGDLRPKKDADGKVVAADAKNSAGVSFYKLNGDETAGRMERSTVAEQPVQFETTEPLLQGASSGGESVRFTGWAWLIKTGGRNGITWKPGTAYGFEFSNIQLPKNFIFGSNYSRTTKTPIAGEASLHFSVSVNSGSGSTGGVTSGGTIDVYSLRPGSSGTLTAQRVDKSENPTQQLNN